MTINLPCLPEMVPLLGTLERDEENHIDLDDAATEEKLKKRRLPAAVTSAIKSLVCSHWNHKPRVFAGYGDGFLRVFHLHTREQLLCFQAHDHAVRALTIVQVSLSRPVCPCLIPSLSLSDSPLSHHLYCRPHRLCGSLLFLLLLWEAWEVR
jgi:hypothetical protein